MRWNTPIIGEKRIRTFFAWTPVCANYTEYRWLETVTVEEEYGHFVVGDEIRLTWHAHRFIDEQPIKK